MCHTPDAPEVVAPVGVTARAACTPLRVGVTMSMHKLTAGSGYDYLTRQVAALDATEKGHPGWRLITPNAVRRQASGSVRAWTGSTALPSATR